MSQYTDRWRLTRYDWDVSNALFAFRRITVYTKSTYFRWMLRPMMLEFLHNLILKGAFASLIVFFLFALQGTRWTINYWDQQVFLRDRKNLCPLCMKKSRAHQAVFRWILWVVSLTCRVIFCCELVCHVLSSLCLWCFESSDRMVVRFLISYSHLWTSDIHMFWWFDVQNFDSDSHSLCFWYFDVLMLWYQNFLLFIFTVSCVQFLASNILTMQTYFPHVSCTFTCQGAWCMCICHLRVLCAI